MFRRVTDWSKQRAIQFIQFFHGLSITRKILVTGALLFSGVLAFTCGLFILTWIGVFGGMPGYDELARVENPLATEVYTADSVLMGRYFIQERSDISFDKLPTHLIQAVLSTEDIRFYDHSGIDVRSLGRVLIKSILLQNDASGGGSTLTQQLAKNLYPRKKYFLFSMLINKMREMIIASRLEGIYDKQSILALYLNTVPFGDNTYGIESAAQRFFSVSAKSLSIEQGAVLIGMLKASTAYNPRLHPERSRERRNVVLMQMAKYEMLKMETAKELMQHPLELKYRQLTHHTGLAPYFREYIRQQLEDWCSTHSREDGKSYNLYTDGLKVYTTLDSRIQQYAEEAMIQQMKLIQERFNNHWGKTDPWHNQKSLYDEAVKRSDRYKSLWLSGLSHDEIINEMQKPVLMNIFTWDGEKEVTMSPLDSIRHYLRFLNAGLLALDPKQGAVKAWVGGINHQYFQYDHVNENTKRQIGSTFKPIVYAAALEQGARPCEFISAEKTTYTGDKEWTPSNTEDNYDQKYSMEGGLAYSVNTVSVHVLEKAGIENTIRLANKMGIHSYIPEVPSIALGTADISMIEMASAYACLANDGVAVKPFYITSITTHRGEIIEGFSQPANQQQVLSEDNARMMVQMLKRVVDEGTASGLRTRYGIKNDVAGKTGTTQSNADGWFMAITPKLVIGSWVGADDPRIRFRTTALGQGARTALPIVGDLLQRINADDELKDISQAQFRELPSKLERRLSCNLSKSDETVLERIFGKKTTSSKRAFGDKKAKKKGFFKRLFGS
ncbi:MAG TPA: transglycosylase domain-containing protein [Ohtaekwangia sp.]